MIAQQSLECGDPAPLWIWYGVTKAGLTRRRGGTEKEKREMQRTMKDLKEMKLKKLEPIKQP